MEKKLPQLIQETLASFPVKQPLRLMFQDEARFGRISDCCYCWCKEPLRPLVKAMLSHQYVYAYAAVSPQDGKLDSLVLPEVNGQWMQAVGCTIAGSVAEFKVTGTKVCGRLTSVPWLYSRNQRCTMLALMPCRIATPAMDAPGWAQAPTTCSLSSGL